MTDAPAAPTLGAEPAAAPRRRALVVGIDVYMPEGTAMAPVVRPVSNLQGSVNDALAMHAALTSRFGFPLEETLLLRDQEAGREAILRAFREHLIGPSKPGDEVAFFYAGHGSQVANPASDDLDKLDETIVPADAAFGAPDLRDKELRRLFNALLDKGVRLTAILDSCHSGSAWRGLPPAGLSRSLPRAPGAVADPPPYGPRPEDRGALILAAAQDYESAWETRDAEDRPRGAFSLALLTAIESAGPGESVEEVYQRARARLQTAAARQEPVLAGTAERRSAPLFGESAAAGSGARVRRPVAVQRVEYDGLIRLQGGWTSGLVEGSELVRRSPTPETPPVTIRVSARPGPASAEARVVVPEPPAAPEVLVYRDGRPASSIPTPVEVEAPALPKIEPGDLFDLVGWTVAGGASLRVWIPSAEGTALAAARRLAGELAAAAGRDFDWVADPTEVTPTHLLRPRGAGGEGWELAGPGGTRTLAGGCSTRSVLGGIAQLGPAGSERPRLFVHLPVPATLAESIRLGAGTINSAVAKADGPADTHYHLVGRLVGGPVQSAGALQVAWIRPDLGSQDRVSSSLPVRSEWLRLNLAEDVAEVKRAASPDGVIGLASSKDSKETPGIPPPRPTHPLAYPLEDTALRLAKIRAWLTLDSPPDGDFPYKLGLRRRGTTQVLGAGELRPGEYDGLLWTVPEEVCRSYPRSIYLFVLDSYGRSTLLFPSSTQGGIENRLPILREGEPPPLEVPCGRRPVVRVGPPYGTDTYFLLSTQEPLGNPAILEADGVRRGEAKRKSALEDLLAHRGNAERGGTAITPEDWSLHRVVFQSVPG